MSEAYIVAAGRTASGLIGGRLKDLHPADLAAEVLTAVIARAGVDPSGIEGVLMGCVVQQGEQSGDVARGAVLAAGLPQSIPTVTIDRQCGSSHQAMHFAIQAIMSGTQDLIIAGGVESLSRVAFGASPLSARVQARYGVEAFDLIEAAERVTAKYGFSREALDAYALRSHQRAAAAVEQGAFDAEIVPVTTGDGGDDSHRIDEGIRFDATLEGIAAVPSIRRGGLVSPAGGSYLCDGASAVLVASERAVREHGLRPLARVRAIAVTAGDPVLMLDEPIAASRKALSHAGFGVNDLDLYEVMESFSAIPLAWLEIMGGDPSRLNAQGGALALGHPLGASGTRLMTTLVHALRRSGGRYGLQTMCEGGGIAHATIVESLAA